MHILPGFERPENRGCKTKYPRWHWIRKQEDVTKSMNLIPDSQHVNPTSIGPEKVGAREPETE